MLTLLIAPGRSASSSWMRVVHDVSSEIFEQETTADLPAATHFRSPRQFINKGATAAAVGHDRFEANMEADY